MTKMSTRLVTLIENTTWQTRVLAEWGLSILIEKDGRGILLDAGETISVPHNSQALGIDLTKIDTIVLSHGHFDHTGGLSHVLASIGHDVTIIAHPEIWANKYHREANKPDRYIGIPDSQKELEALGAKFNLSREPVKIEENIFSTGECPMQTDFETIDPLLFIKSRDGWQPDSVLDDQGIVIKTSQGLVVIAGCVHRGLINTLYQARKITGEKKIYMVVGGTHLFHSSDERIWKTISALNEMGVQKLSTCHCTGMRANMLLAQAFGKNFILNGTGTIINLN
jgi:7,8-dihydropterin-6-yl-methyl-4-(beta-D-ribofuranosyl)aminobenzene 5'-phosphate synthase